MRNSTLSKIYIQLILQTACLIQVSACGSPDTDEALASESISRPHIMMPDVCWIARYKAGLPRFEGISGPGLCEAIVKYLLMFSQIQNPSTEDTESFTSKIHEKIEAAQELKFFFKGFPFKSTNPKRCGNVQKPDGAEYMSLLLLNHIACEISKAYPTRFIIFSDGHPHIVGYFEPTSKIIMLYHAGIESMLGAFPKVEFHDGLDSSLYHGLEELIYAQLDHVPDDFRAMVPTTIGAKLTPEDLKEFVALMNAESKPVDEGIVSFFKGDLEEIMDKGENSKMEHKKNCRSLAKTLERRYAQSQANLNLFLKRHLKGFNELIHFSIHNYGDFDRFPLSVIYPPQERHICPWQGLFSPDAIILKASDQTARK